MTSVDAVTATCVVCGQPCEGTTGAVIDDVFRPMCHEGPDPTCYQQWMWDVSGVRPDITQIENQIMWEDDHA